jgi:flagella basal body P-ring formation protein FlgA
MTKLSLLLSVVSLSVSLAAPAQAQWQVAGTAAPAEAATIAPLSAADRAYFKITTQDVAAAVAAQLEQQAIATKAQVRLSASSNPTLYHADSPLKLVVHALQVDPSSKRWQAQANILSEGKTISVKPVSGTYTAMIAVPVLKRQLGRGDIIEANDLDTKTVAEGLLRKDSITDAGELIGQSPRAIISSDRPIRQAEVSAPLVIRKGQPVEVTYTSPHMRLKITGVALQDGAKGELIRIKNDKSEKSVSGKVMASGHVEVNQERAL